jgi:hypothetical protein
MALVVAPLLRLTLLGIALTIVGNVGKQRW